jgi:hypothetical protein
MRQKLPKIGRQRFERQTPLARRRRHFRLERISKRSGKPEAVDVVVL